ncbi:regulatory protein YycI of two-component signal transduction system YycFG [Paenibacillus phyllosphaerae]|uniref:Regulatory protein YycI of two-component signal transduction system YycFG n=1 Tax=Paenibacillus phyllosphaerae TaxID=274593 RepID=A0A7W5AZE3_9BACL|nr:two-component system regulatory protein YycI [Paenibacillus phyllosphaerae]MBB3110886.1 regulatory protein YycI of two-component signal transduction system YycFG [Paenibacillus phyllosphaerae]
MDWGRAKSVLILAFLLLNVALGYQLLSSIGEGLSPSTDVNDLPAETLAMIREKRIELEASIPPETPELRDLTYKAASEPGGGERTVLKTPVENTVVYQDQKLEDALGGVIPNLDQYTFDQAVSRDGVDGVFVLYRMVEGRPMFDVKLELYYSNQKIVAYKQDQIELMNVEETEKQEVLPATKAAASLIDRNYLPTGAVIKEIKLGYHHGQIFNSEIQVSAPSWRILLEDGSAYYVNAISGEVVTGKENES